MPLYGDSIYGDAVYSSGTSTIPDESPPPAPLPPELARLEDRWEWYAPGASSPLAIYVVRPGAELLIAGDPSGLDSVPRGVSSTSAPGQYGTTAVGTSAAHRVISLQFYVRASTVEGARQKRAEVASALATDLTPFASRPPLGTLRIIRNGRPDVQIEAHPVDESPRLVGRVGPSTLVMAADFYCPNPLFRSVVSYAHWLGSAEGGFHFLDPFAFVSPWYALDANDAETITYEGDVPSPIVVDFYGEMTGPQIVNEETGEAIVLDADLAEGERLRVTTGVGRSSVEFQNSSGVWSDGWGMLDLTVTSMWLLRRGAQTVRLSASTNTSGRARIAWADWFVAA